MGASTSPIEYRHRRHPTVPGHRLVQWRPTDGNDARWRFLAWTRTVREATQTAYRNIDGRLPS